MGCVLALALVTVTHGTAGIAVGGAAGAAEAVAVGGVRGLGLRGGRELETRRKPFDQNDKAEDVILKDWKKKEAQPPSALENLIAETLLKHSSTDRYVCCGGRRV